MNRMVDISVGGLSPTINWGDLKHQEFLLPPKDQQAELAELLWANQNLSDSRKDLFHNLKDTYLSQIEKSLISKHAPKVSLYELTDVIRGIGYKPDELMERMDNSSFVLLRSNNIDQGRINFDQIQILPLSKLKEEQLLRVGDFAICMSNGSKKLVGKLAPFYFSENPTSVGSFCAILRPKTLQAQKIILHLGESLTYRQMIERMISGSAINNLKPEDIYSLFFRVNYQNIENTLLHLENLRLMQEVVMNDRIKINELQKSIINQIF
jgi:type I restriction enzyme S subunit